MNKASGGDGIPVELFQVIIWCCEKCCESAAFNMPANMENSAVATELEKVSFHPNTKGNANECSNYCTIALISKYASKLTLKILQASMWTKHVNLVCSHTSTVCELRNYRCTSWILKRQRNQRSNCQHFLDYRKSKELQKNIYYCFID